MRVEKKLIDIVKWRYYHLLNAFYSIVSYIGLEWVFNLHG